LICSHRISSAFSLLPIEATVIEMIPVRFLIEEQDYMDEQIIDSAYKENMR